MAYVALSRRWRPQKFEDVVGQVHVVRTLQNVLKTGRVHHAYLFTGPRGVGKTTMARLFAKALNCPNRGETLEPCNECDSCHEISLSRSLDVVEIDAASNNGVDDIRELRENVKLGTVASRYRVYIVDEAHMLSMPAWNALLKTLEEPPSHVVFVFASTQRDRFPATILSRCQQFDFHRMTHGEIVTRLRELAEADGLQVDELGLGLIAAQADGCLRDAQSTLEQVIAYSDGPVDADDVGRILGYGSASTMSALTEALVARQAPAAIAAAAELATQGADPGQCLRLLLTFFHGLMRLKLNDQVTSAIGASATSVDEMRAFAQRMSIDRIQWTIRLLMRAERDMKLLQYDAYNFELALLDVCRVEEGVPIDRVLQRLEELRAEFDAVATNVPTAAPLAEERASPAATAHVEDDVSERVPPSELEEPAPEWTEDSLAHMWRLVRDHLGKSSPGLAANLEQATPHLADGGLRLEFRHAIHLTFVERRKSDVDEALAHVVGRSISITLAASDDAPAQQVDSIPERAAQDERSDQEQLVLGMFTGRLDGKSPKP